MRNDPALWPSPLWHLKKFTPDAPVLYFAPEVLQATARRFLQGFDGLVTYAVKANDHEAVLSNLVGAGLSAFDVASPLEMARVRAVAPDAVLHYHNPVRSRAEIAEAVGHGIASWSVDCPHELEKLVDVPRQGTEIAVRLRLPVAGAAYDFGEKFGADPDLAVALLRQAQQMGFATSLTFHPGTQCADPQAWAVYIVEAADVAKRAGVTLQRLNVGGGFAAHRSGVAPDLEAIFDRIARETKRAFGVRAPALVCEPGRAMVAEAFTLAVRVKAVRDSAVFLNDGIYGALTELRDIGVPDRISVVRSDGRSVTGENVGKVVYGPTCDSLDRLPDPVALPADIEEGDFVMIRAMGAYSASLSTGFNGYGLQQMTTVAAL
ncbi:type III PLP-dependent enzyme [Shimia sp. R11_0]|uniref:type III PLP-dependent enzyme n=1 Tax=Shimia sp. R11_0 TaxID=2821096 RepID=UPI001ADC548E|nr:type III PLP-dependent enzyme [Shimia sp. R11_0]MBO9479442.1 type III PLP-dependent enzyme [Shimia sp. R11_0]